MTLDSSTRTQFPGDSAMSTACLLKASCLLLLLTMHVSCVEEKQIHFTISGGWWALWDCVKIFAKTTVNTLINMYSVLFAQPTAKGLRDAITPSASATARLYHDVGNIMFPDEASEYGATSTVTPTTDDRALKEHIGPKAYHYYQTKFNCQGKCRLCDVMGRLYPKQCK